MPRRGPKVADASVSIVGSKSIVYTARLHALLTGAVPLAHIADAGSQIMGTPMDPSESSDLTAPAFVDRYGRSLDNLHVENEGLRILLADPRFQVLPTSVKRLLVESMGFAASGSYGVRTFDAVMTPEPEEPISAWNLERLLPTLRLIEMKTSRKAIPDASLRNFFFGATKNEYDLAALLGDRFLFAFVVLNDHNVYGRPFVVLLTLAQIEARTKTKRVQYQVNLGPTAAAEQVEVIVPGTQ